MTRDEATRLMAGYLAMSSSVSAVGDFGSFMKDEAERREVAEGLGHVVSTIYERCMKPVIAQYPDLDPDVSRWPTKGGAS